MIGVIAGSSRVGRRNGWIKIDISGREDIKMVHTNSIVDSKIIVIVIEHGDSRRNRINIGRNGSRVGDSVVVGDSFNERGYRGYCGR
jgi:hypothetical protein